MNASRHPVSLLRLLNNLLLVYLLYMLCRVVYVLEFWDLYAAGWSQLSLSNLLAGGLRFDTSAILVTNIPYIVLMLLPWHGKERPAYQQFCRWVFVIVNGIAFVVNLADSVYFQYTMRRTTTSVFQEFSHEGNLTGIIGKEFLSHWYLVLLFVLVMMALSTPSIFSSNFGPKRS